MLGASIGVCGIEGGVHVVKGGVHVVKGGVHVSRPIVNISLNTLGEDYELRERYSHGLSAVF